MPSHTRAAHRVAFLLTSHCPQHRSAQASWTAQQYALISPSVQLSPSWAHLPVLAGRQRLAGAVAHRLRGSRRANNLSLPSSLLQSRPTALCGSARLACDRATWGAASAARLLQRKPQLHPPKAHLLLLDRAAQEGCKRVPALGLMRQSQCRAVPQQAVLAPRHGAHVALRLQQGGGGVCAHSTFVTEEASGATN